MSTERTKAGIWRKWSRMQIVFPKPSLFSILRNAWEFRCFVCLNLGTQTGIPRKAPGFVTDRFRFTVTCIILFTNIEQTYMSESYYSIRSLLTLNRSELIYKFLITLLLIRNARTKMVYQLLSWWRPERKGSASPLDIKLRPSGHFDLY